MTATASRRGPPASRQANDGSGGILGTKKARRKAGFFFRRKGGPLRDYYVCALVLIVMGFYLEPAVFFRHYYAALDKTLSEHLSPLGLELSEVSSHPTQKYGVGLWPQKILRPQKVWGLRKANGIFFWTMRNHI